MSRDMKIGFEKPYPDEERMRRGLLYWQYAGSRPPNQEEQCEFLYIHIFLVSFKYPSWIVDDDMLHS